MLILYLQILHVAFVIFNYVKSIAQRNDKLNFAVSLKQEEVESDDIVLRQRSKGITTLYRGDYPSDTTRRETSVHRDDDADVANTRLLRTR